MKKTFFFLVLSVMLLTTVNAQQTKVLSNDYNELRLSFSVGNIVVKDVAVQRQQFQAIVMDGFGSQPAVGMPALPQLVNLIEVPLGDGLYYTVLSMDADTIDGEALGLGKAVVPAQPSRRKSDDGDDVLHINHAAYVTDAFVGQDVVTLQSMGVARNRNLARVLFNPLRWNPVTNELIIVKNITISVRQRNADIAATKRLQRLYASAAYNSSYDVINTLGGKDNHTAAPLRYTIVANSMFRGTLDDFAAWKRRKGFLVDLVYTDDPQVGNTTTSIKAYLQGLYDNATEASPAPTFVLFVGDVEQLPAFYLTAYNEQQYSDLTYCCWTGGDNIPDCYYGRFSAQNVNQLLPQIEKTLMYEQYIFPDDSYLSTAALIAGVDGGYSSDNAYHYADPTMDYVAKTYVNTGNGFTNIVYYKNNTSFAPAGVSVTGSSNSTSAATALRQLYNQGCGWVNYSAHGDNTYWYKPNFTTDHVSSMTNNDKPMVMIGNCCLTNSFQVDACLGEALLRKGNNAGAVAYVGASNSTYWVEDFYWSVGIRNNISNTMNTTYDASNMGMYDHLFHTHGEPFADWYSTMGGMIYRGNMSVEASSSSSSMKQYYWQIYHLMGDPSLMPYCYGRGLTMNPTLPNVLTIGSEEFEISDLPPYAYVAFNSPEGELLAAAFADSTGNVMLSFDAISRPDTFEVVATAQGYKPFFGAIGVLANGPYVCAVAMTPTSGVIAGEDVSFDLTLKNYGVDDAENLLVDFQSADGGLVIDTTGFVELGMGLAAGQQLTLHSVCHAGVWEQMTDQSALRVRVVVRWGNTSEDEGVKAFNFVVNADRIKMQEYEVNTSFEEGDTVVLTVTSKNIGHAAMDQGTITLLSLDPVVGILNATDTLYNIAPDSSVTLHYDVVLRGDAPQNCRIPVLQLVSNGSVTSRDTIMLVFGIVNAFVTFESGDFDEVDWTFGEYPWEITAQNAYAGTYCARSKTWSSMGGGNTNCDLVLSWTSTVDDSISFFKKVSSEENYDFFRFYIDGQAVESASGTGSGWSRSSFPIYAGFHIFKFSYEKDASVNRDSDCAWIDNISLPFSGNIHYYWLDSTCQGSIYVLGDSVINTEFMEPGFHQFADTVDGVYTVLTLMVTAKPEVTIEGGGTIRAGETVRLTASGADSYLWSNGSTNPVIDVYPTETTTYYVTGMNGNCSDTASVTVVVDGTIGIDEVRTTVDDVVLFPNPAHQSITVSGADLDHIVISNVTGRVIDTVKAGMMNRIDVSCYSKGVYFVQIFDKKGNISVKKFVKD